MTDQHREFIEALDTLAVTCTTLAARIEKIPSIPSRGRLDRLDPAGGDPLTELRRITGVLQSAASR